MIIYVRLNNYNEAEHSLVVQSHYAWEMGRLLSDANFRNQFKYLVAMKEGEVLEVYCIIGLAEYTPNEGSNRRRVKFLLEPVADDCFNQINDLIERIKQNDRSKIVNQGGHYITEEYLNLNGYTLPSDCDCGIDGIEFIENPNDPRFIKQNKQRTKARK
jgi:hypothetical protein